MWSEKAGLTSRAVSDAVDLMMTLMVSIKDLYKHTAAYNNKGF